MRPEPLTRAGLELARLGLATPTGAHRVRLTAVLGEVRGGTQALWTRPKSSGSASYEILRTRQGARGLARRLRQQPRLASRFRICAENCP